MRDLDARVCEMAWRALVIVVPIVLWRLSRVARRDLLLALLLGAIALLPRLMLPWGPLNFVESERIFPVWTRNGVTLNEFLAIPLALQNLQRLGIGLEALVHYAEPIVGALTVALTYGCARAFSLNRWHSTLAAVLVGCWPAHVHFSESLSFSVDASALIVATIGAAAATSLGWVSVPLITVLATIAIHTRPELRFLLIPVGLLVFWPGSHWTNPKRIALVLSLGVALLSYLPTALAKPANQELAVNMRPDGKELLFFLAGTILLNGTIWLVLATFGVLNRALPARLHWPLFGGFVVFGAVYWCLSSDPSLLWTQWRYAVTLVPLFSIAAAAEVARRWPHESRRAALICMAVAVASLAVEWRFLRLPNDQQVEFHYVRETAAQAMPPSREVYMVRFPDCAIGHGSAAMALSTLYGPVQLPSGSLDETASVRLRVLDAQSMTRELAATLSGVVYVGSRIHSETTEFLDRWFTLTPVHERTVETIADHLQCGRWADPTAKCSIKMGWYRFQPRVSDQPVIGAGN